MLESCKYMKESKFAPSKQQLFQANHDVEVVQKPSLYTSYKISKWKDN
jgi:hypothetical protein